MVEEEKPETELTPKNRIQKSTSCHNRAQEVLNIYKMIQLKIGKTSCQRRYLSCLRIRGYSFCVLLNACSSNQAVFLMAIEICKNPEIQLYVEIPFFIAYKAA
jgi:hypothetical protein